VVLVLVLVLVLEMNRGEFGWAEPNRQNGNGIRLQTE
jgi:hypothetical protein